MTYTLYAGSGNTMEAVYFGSLECVLSNARALLEAGYVIKVAGDGEKE